MNYFIIIICMKFAVVTGVSGGMGLATLKKLTNSGYYVFGLDLKKPKYDYTDNFTFIKTDITDEKSVQKAYKEVAKHNEELDAIISMAGIYDMNSLIEMSEEDFIRIFDINVFGIYRVNKTFVPLLKENGKVIMVSSELAPLDPLPFTGIYAITKSTVEKYAYSLRMELQLLNKQVVVIRPGAIDTQMIESSNERIEKFTENTRNYKWNAEKFKSVIDSVEAKKIPAEKIAKLVNRILNKRKPKYVYKINRNKLLLLMHLLPKRMQNWAIRRILLKK